MTSGWDESMATGNELIDGQHRSLFGLLDVLSTAEDRGAVAVWQALADLSNLTLDHFMAEEHLMVEVFYPAAARHSMVRQHHEFAAYARLRALEFHYGKLRSIVPLELYYREFLTQHALGLDRLLVDWIKNRWDERC